MYFCSTYSPRYIFSHFFFLFTKKFTMSVSHIYLQEGVCTFLLNLCVPLCDLSLTLFIEFFGTDTHFIVPISPCYALSGVLSECFPDIPIALILFLCVLLFLSVSRL